MLRYGTNLTLSNATILVDPAEEASIRKFKAIFPFDSKRVFGQISLKDGEILVEVTPDREGWTVVKNADGKEGGVPTNCLGSSHLDITSNNTIYVRGSNHVKYEENESFILL